jgi:beta-glucosidase
MAFPEGFWWGTAASSTQAEGAAPASDYFRWEQAGRVPASGDGNGFATRYAEDFRLYAGFGLTHHRLSLEWARIEPAEGKRDRAEIERYRAMLTAARDAGLHIWVCLHHFSLPAWFADPRGFLDDRSRSYYWRRHVEFVAEAFGDLVFGWKPINEPLAFAAGGWLSGALPPGVRDVERFRRALRATHLANYDAWRVLRSGGKPVSTIMNLSPLYPGVRPDKHEDIARAETMTAIFDATYWTSWIRALRDGVLAIPGLPEESVPEMAGAFDLIGFSYYNAAMVYADGTTGPYPLGARMGPMGYAPWSEGLGIVLRRLARELPGRPILICEHGVGTTDDAWRQAVLTESLREAERAIAEGIDVRGFFHWTGVDNYEWTYGWDVPFGLFDRERKPRASAALMSRFARSAGGE